MAAKKKIKILKDGPYEVSGSIPLNQAEIVPDQHGAGKEWKVGKAYSRPEGDYHLCRCGHSKNKPYCDGAHARIGFDGTEVADKAPYEEQAKVYEGDAVDLMDQESLCAVARFCDRGAGVWAMAVASSDEGNLKMATYEACACPSGRLTIRKKDGSVIEPDLPQEVSLVEDPAKAHRGPLWVKGGIEIEGADGEAYEVRNRVTLCRCGESGNMPFCDASHLMCKHMEGLD